MVFTAVLSRIKVKEKKAKLEAIKQRLTEIAKARRGDRTTVKLSGVSGVSVITFRESYEADNKIFEIARDLGSLFDRFFTKKEKYHPSKELKQFIEGKNNFGFDDPSAIRDLISKYIKKKVVKPNVKFTA